VSIFIDDKIISSRQIDESTYSYLSDNSHENSTNAYSQLDHREALKIKVNKLGT